jgi:hypothetical protein
MGSEHSTEKARDWIKHHSSVTPCDLTGNPVECLTIFLEEARQEGQREAFLAGVMAENRDHFFWLADDTHRRKLPAQLLAEWEKRSSDG